MLYVVRIDEPGELTTDLNLKGKNKSELARTLYSIDTYEKDLFNVAISDSTYELDAYGDIVIGDDDNPVLVPLSEGQLAEVINDNLGMIVEQLDNNPLAQRCYLKPESFVIPMSTIDAFGDTLGLDEETWGIVGNALSEESNVKRHIVALSDQDGNFHGQIWSFTREGFPYIAMYGIRGSFIDVLCKTKPPRIATSLVAGVAALARTDKRIKELVVPWPLQAMAKILRLMGFEEHNELEMTPERQFLAPITTTSGYWTIDIDKLPNQEAKLFL